MSRSNPDSNTPNPATRWFEWNGEAGVVRYYDKDAKANVDIGATFRFVLLDQLSSVRGWHEASQSGIYSNEVRDTRQDVMIVKAFKGGQLAEGLYKDIKDRVNTVGGQFVANCYIAFRVNTLAIGSLRFKGSSLGAWMEFSKAHRADLYRKAIQIDGFTEGKKGRIVYRVPVFRVTDLSESANAEATALDIELQEFLSGYLSRTKRDQVDAPAASASPDHDEAPEYDGQGQGQYTEPEYAPITDDDIPF